MKLQQCTTCNKQFTWKQILKSLFLGNQPMKCENCGTVYRISNSSKYISVFFILGLAFILLLIELPTNIRFSILLFAYVIFLLIFPFIATYNRQKK
ncbi:TIGR04104 family putative zinc finger protein [Aquibacillus rhizosphaerae]|uniref:TIGR04104 family putative zinc finger protein n=1 Tax=Aquibacillus rhizosphaerae TaxID=3051431 RepID=UPI0038B33670